MKQGRLEPVRGLCAMALDASDDNPELALLVAVRFTRWKMIAAGELEQLPFERPVPVEILRATEDEAAEAALA